MGNPFWIFRFDNGAQILLGQVLARWVAALTLCRIDQAGANTLLRAMKRVSK
jgi:hypothetical protein